jgi:geranylgeranylglycerol-phosphate geranylgeranyltransferase
VETWRPYTSCYVGLVGLAGASLGASHPALGGLVAAWAIPTMGWLAGLYGGDFFDRRLDAISKPQRPIPSGRISPATALGCMIALIGAAAVWTVLLNWRALIVVAVATAVGLSYNGFFKSRGLAGNIVRGCLTAFAFAFGALVAGGGGGSGASGAGVSGPVVAVAAIFALQDSDSNLVGTLRDIDGDRAGGYETFPVRHGVPPAIQAIATLVGCWSLLALAAPDLTGRPWAIGYAVPIAAAMVMSWSVVARLWRQRDSVTPPFALRMHEWLCLERVILASSFVALGGHPALASGIGLPALAVTWRAQVSLRARHEFAAQYPVPVED